MGIANLNNFLRKNCIEVFEEIHISEYAYKKVAIDTSLFLCKFNRFSYFFFVFFTFLFCF